MLPLLYPGFVLRLQSGPSALHLQAVCANPARQAPILERNVSIRTANGGHAAVGKEFDYSNTTHAERSAIVAREERLAEWRKTLPRRRKPDHEKPGPLTWIQLS